MMAHPHWIEYVKAFGPAIIAAFVAYIAYQQWQINRANLREKLFDRRFELFKTAHRFLSVVVQDAKVPDESLPEFFDAIQRSRFLFGTDIQKYLKEVNSRAQQMRLYQIKREGLSVGEEKSKIVELESQELKWLCEQTSEVFDKFEPYLGFEKHK